MDDLSLRHQPLTNLFPAMEESRLRLSPQQLEQFRTQGYVAGIPVLDQRQADELCRQLAELTDPGHPGRELWHEYHSNESQNPETVLFHALGAWRLRSGYHDLLWHDALTVPAGQLLEGPVRFWHDQLFCKPAHHGGVVAWHQDYSYWTRTRPMAHLTCWIGLDESTSDNGCLCYIPGSHLWELLPVTGLAGDMQAIRQVLNQQQLQQFENPVRIKMRRGEASFHHPLLVHGSFENRTPGPRRAAVVNLCRDGVCSDSDQPLLQGIPPIAPGQPLDGQFFPLLRA